VECSGPKPTSLDMAARKDAEELQKRVWGLAKDGKSVELKVVMEDHTEVDVDGYKDASFGGQRALAATCCNGHTECARLLIDHKANVDSKDGGGYTALHGAADGGHMTCVELLVLSRADVNCQTNVGWTPLMFSTLNGQLTVAQYLLEQKADVDYRVSEGVCKNWDALRNAMCYEATDRSPGIAFVFLSCNTDAKNYEIDFQVTTAVRDAHMETYKHVQAFIDEYQRILNLVLSEHVQVDMRVGRGDDGIQHEHRRRRSQASSDSRPPAQRQLLVRADEEESTTR
jgi:hypothetical protein